MVTDRKTSEKEYPKLEIFGDDVWVLLCKAQVKGEWLKTTKVMPLNPKPGITGKTKGGEVNKFIGPCLVQTETEKFSQISQAVVYVPRACFCVERAKDGSLIRAYFE